MKTYSISYDTELGAAHYEGDKPQHYQTFIAEATKAGRKMGLIAPNDSVLDHDYELDAD
tara:strand:- start:3171 stop:3347 length:177 start_codon:yes stop_codon:yes gene_type:complete